MRLYLFALLAVMAILVFACAPTEEKAEEKADEKGEKKEKEKKKAEKPVDPKEMAAKLWAKAKDGNYQEWVKAADMMDAMGGGENPPHGVKVTIYFNENAAKAKEENADAMPDGAIVIKDGFNEDGSIKHYAAMAKKNGKWFWAIYMPDESVMMATWQGEEDAQMCDQCHAQGGRDMVRIWEAK